MSDEKTISISIPADDEGYILLKCGHCGTFFKGIPSDIQDEKVLDIYCPSCGLTSESYITDDAQELVEKMAINMANDMIYDMFKELEKHSKSSMIKIKAGKQPKHEEEDPIHSGIDALEICTFACCNRSAKIKPLLKMTGAYCPFCGVKNYEIE